MIVCCELWICRHESMLSADFLREVVLHQQKNLLQATPYSDLMYSLYTA